MEQVAGRLIIIKQCGCVHENAQLGWTAWPMIFRTRCNLCHSPKTKTDRCHQLKTCAFSPWRLALCILITCKIAMGHGWHFQILTPYHPPCWDWSTPPCPLPWLWKPKTFPDTRGSCLPGLLQECFLSFFLRTAAHCSSECIQSRHCQEAETTGASGVTESLDASGTEPFCLHLSLIRHL